MELNQTQDYSIKTKAFNPDYLTSLEAQILSSPYLAESKLSNSFTGTKGFSVVFQRSEIDKVGRHFPFFNSYLRSTLLPECNIFYLNPLMLGEGVSVKSHTDCSISGYCQDDNRLIPKVVSVLYVKVPADMKGGELILFTQKFQVRKIQPQTNTLLYFSGNLRHSVNQVQTSEARISLVCEQYTLDRTKLQHLPKFNIESLALQYS